MIGEEFGASGPQDAAPEQGAPAPQTRDRSTIEFPYLPLEAAEEVAQAIYRRCGHGSCEIDELAAEMNQSVSGAFRQKTAAAKTFGLVEKDGRSAFKLSEIGRKLVIEDTAGIGRVEGFLSVPLYAAIYDKYRGHNLPPAKALEREMEGLGVARKQTDKARQAFDRSAQHSGFFDAGRDRLVKPRLDVRAPQPDTGIRNDVGGDGEKRQTGGGKEPVVDPIIKGLLDRLPDSGSVWPNRERELWLELLAGSFNLIYKSDDGPQGHKE